MDWILKVAQSSEAHHRESALVLIGNLCMHLVDAFKSAEQFQLLHNLLVSGLQDQSSLGVRLAALTTSAGVIQVFTSGNHRNKLREIIPLMLETIAVAIREQAADETIQAVKMFIELVGQLLVSLRYGSLSLTRYGCCLLEEPRSDGY